MIHEAGFFSDRGGSPREERKRMGNKLKATRKSYRKVRNSYLALRQDNYLPRQLPHMARHSGVWIQMVKNLREVEGSWTRTIRRLLLMYEGVPRRKG